MESFKRYAIYYAPSLIDQTRDFAEFCTHWLGWDAFEGMEVAHPDVPGLPMPVAEITETPRKYGFHGTLKPPFHLTGTVEDVMADLESFAATHAPVELDGLALTQIGGFLALTPTGDLSGLETLAGEIVAKLEPHCINSAS